MQNGRFLILLLAGCVVFTILTIKSKESSRSRNFLLGAIYVAIAVVAVILILVFALSKNKKNNVALYTDANF